MVGINKQSQRSVLGFTERNTIIAIGSGDFLLKNYLKQPAITL